MAITELTPVEAAREQLRETLKVHVKDEATRESVIGFVIEEFECQFATPDNEMIIAGQEVLDAAAGAHTLDLFHRRCVIELIWCAMADKAFGR